MDFVFMDFVESNWTWIMSSPMIYEIKPKKGPRRIRVKAQTKKGNRGSNRWVNGWVKLMGQPMGMTHGHDGRPLGHQVRVVAKLTWLPSVNSKEVKGRNDYFALSFENL